MKAFAGKQPAPQASRGQVIVLFVLFLLVLLGISALAVDYASWLLTDRALQNYSDHASLAGASAFDQRTSQGSCSGGAGAAQCVEGRKQAWASLNNDLSLGMSDAEIACLAAADSPAAGETTSARAFSGCTSGSPHAFGHTIWVSTPPPNAARYTNYGGRYAQNFGVVWVRLDRNVRSFLGGALGIQPQPRTGWSTAGALPTDFALEIFCRNNRAPQSGVCENSAGLTIDGQGGVTLVRGDVGSNESLTVTSNVGNGVIVKAGNVFLVNRSCSSGTWNCPNSPPRGGISDAVNGKNAYYIAPLPVPQYESPTDFAPNSLCASASLASPCIPYRNQYGADPTSSGTWTGNWTCGDGTTACGTPSGSGSSLRCSAGSYDPNTRFMRPNTDDLNQNNRWTGSQYNSNGARYQNINDASVDPAGTLPATSPGSAVLAGTPTNFVSSDDGQTTKFRVALSPPQGVPSGTNLTVRYVLFNTVNHAYNATATGTVPVTVRLYEKVGSTYTLRGTAQAQNASNAITVYQYDVPMSSMTGATWYNNLYLEFEVTSGVASRGAGVSWAETEIPSLLPATPPTIKPGYWKSIVLPANSCAILDPSPATGLLQYQLPGVYRFGGSGSGANAPRIVLGTGSYLIGDGVTLLFDPRSGGSGFPDNGIDIGTSGALVINASTTSNNLSYPLTDLPYDALGAAWQVDPTDATNPRDGENAWPVCQVAGNNCVPRACYLNTDPAASQCTNLTVTRFPLGRGISFYFTPNTWTHASAAIQRRFYMSGSGAADAPGIDFQGVLYAPYDDVKISARNNFNTIGQVVSWTAKFNGGSAGINLDYPYPFVPASPYLLEPTIPH